MFNNNQGQGGRGDSRQFVHPSAQKNFFNAGEAQAQTERARVRAYFIGWKLLGDNGKSPSFLVKGRKYDMPEIGGYIDIDEVHFEDLRGRSQMWDQKNGRWIDGVTTDGDLARAIKMSYDAGTLGETLDNYMEIFQQSALSTLTDDELEKEIARRKQMAELATASEDEPKASVEEEKPQEEVVASTVEVVETPPKQDKPKRGRPRKS